MQSRTHKFPFAGIGIEGTGISKSVIQKTDVRNMKKKWIFTGVAIIIVIMAISFVQTVEVGKNQTKNWVVALDAGHGGYDPGKVGVSGVLEKDINLAIACKVRTILEKQGVDVIMTRSTDVDLCSEKVGSKKSSDMRKRVEIMNASGAAIAVSIHQNSYTDAGPKGAQVFYYETSQQGKELADTLQNNIKNEVGDDNQRVPKANHDYYILKKVTCPVVIVECGFLSNPTEEMLLTEEDYQEKMAQGIAKGIVEYVKRISS